MLISVRFTLWTSSTQPNPTHLNLSQPNQNPIQFNPSQTNPTQSKPKPTQVKPTQVKPTQANPTQVNSTQTQATPIQPNSIQPNPFLSISLHVFYNWVLCKWYQQSAAVKLHIIKNSCRNWWKTAANQIAGLWQSVGI